MIKKIDLHSTSKVESKNVVPGDDQCAFVNVNVKQLGNVEVGEVKYIRDEQLPSYMGL